MSKGQIAEQAEQAEQIQQPIIPEDITRLFAQVDAQAIETFYQGYQFWTLRTHIDELHTQIEEKQRQIATNAAQMQQIQPSSIALSTLAQLQAHDVDDLDLLERMLEKGDTWLDHTLQLLARCEALDVIRGDYTQWCENALEGAYDWIDSMDQASPVPEPKAEAPLDTTTETLLLQKLLSSEEEQESEALQLVASDLEAAEIAVPSAQPARSRKTGKITQPLVADEGPAQTPQDERGVLAAPEEHASRPVQGKAKVTQPLKLTRPLEVSEQAEQELVTPQTILLNAQTLHSEEQRTDKMPALAHAYMLYSLGVEPQSEPAYTSDDAPLSFTPPTTPTDTEEQSSEYEERPGAEEQASWSVLETRPGDDAATQHEAPLPPAVQQAISSRPTTTREAMTMLANNQPQTVDASPLPIPTPISIETKPKKRGLFARLGFGRRKPRA
jgi:hypothetical protein